MRIHDINVVCDLNEQDPNAPTLPPPTQDPPAGEDPISTDNDGTAMQDPDPDPYVDTIADNAASSTTSWWTGWWPVLHVRSTQVLATGSYSVEISLDILGAFTLVSFDIYVPQLDILNDDGVAMAAQSANTDFWSEAFPQIKLSKYIAEISLLALEVLVVMATPADPIIYGFMIGLLGAWAFSTLVYLYAISEAVRMGLMSAGAAFNECLEMLIFTVGASLVDGYFAAKRFYDVIWSKIAVGTRKLVIWGLVFNVFNLVVKIAFIGLFLSMMTHYLYNHLDPYTQNPAYT
ncbi:MAG: hypothetical protein P1Q69_12290 [Candidatus Thorarchaeota archaeon]|nr:hypothetical protein [Candidatus Thorarchaeota archaeon]